MKSNYLLPYRLKNTGWILLFLGIALGLVFLIAEFEPKFLDVRLFAIASEAIFSDTSYFTFIENNVIDEIIGLLLIVGSIFVALSKEKSEDEFISKIRLESLVWATYINYAILVLAIVFVFDLAFFWILVFNMFTLLFFFIIRFNWALNKSKKMIQDEK